LISIRPCNISAVNPCGAWTVLSESKTVTTCASSAMASSAAYHPGHEADLARTDADVPRRHVGVGTEVAVQFHHERLAEAP
jgi:hypothetical protein